MDFESIIEDMGETMMELMDMANRFEGSDDLYNRYDIAEAMMPKLRALLGYFGCPED